MITNSSKLIEANKDIERLKENLEEATILITKLEVDKEILERDKESLKGELDYFKGMYHALKYDIETRPWWKFW